MTAGERALAAVAETGGGTAINLNTLDALERQGLVKVTSRERRTARVTDAGRVEALKVFAEIREIRVANRASTGYIDGVIARIEREVTR